MRTLALTSLLASLLLATPVAAQDRTLDDIAREQADAQVRADMLAKRRAELEQELTELKARMSDVSERTSALETREANLVERIETLQRDAGTITARIGSDRTTIRDLVAVLQRIEANPPPAIAAGDDTAIDTARAAGLTATVARSLKARTDRLAVDLVELDGVQAELDFEREALSSEREKLSGERAEMRRLAREKTELSRSVSAEESAQTARMEQLAREADTLRELLARVEAAAEAEPRIKPTPPSSSTDPGDIRPRIKPSTRDVTAPRPLPQGLRFADARGQLNLPVRGTVARRFTRDEQGLTVATTAASQVVSPYGGRVEFAGPFKNYERLVILNVGDGYFVVLTGLGQTFVNSGETVAIGEPVGEMPAGSGERELYIEVRKNGRPVDPGPWMDSRSG